MVITKGTWSSLVYGTRFEHEHFKKVVGSNPAVPVKTKSKQKSFIVM
jgi:hypothetical protein